MKVAAFMKKRKAKRQTLGCNCREVRSTLKGVEDKIMNETHREKTTLYKCVLALKNKNLGVLKK